MVIHEKLGFKIAQCGFRNSEYGGLQKEHHVYKKEPKHRSQGFKNSSALAA
jgi:hypothetical protein